MEQAEYQPEVAPARGEDMPDQTEVEQPIDQAPEDASPDAEAAEEVTEQPTLETPSPTPPEAPGAPAEEEIAIPAEEVQAESVEESVEPVEAVEAEPEPAVSEEVAASSVEVPASLAAEVEEALGAAAVPEEGAEPVEEEEEAPALQLGSWYFVHTYAGYENKVKANLESRIVSMNMEDRIFEVVIPVEDVVEIKGGKKQVVQRKLFPGYLLVRMDLDDDSWYVVRNTPGVTGFVGSGARPVPLTEKESNRILQRKPAERPRPRLEWQINDPVRVTTGPFANFQGVVSEIDVDRSKLKVLVNIFGRETPVELGFDQVAKV
jgi:transcription termination/antitermination protein NusG